MNYNTIIIWKFDYHKMRKAKQLLKAYSYQRFLYYESVKKYGSVQIREAFFGGRTNNQKFYHECKDDEEIKYIDFCSLYPCFKN